MRRSSDISNFPFHLRHLLGGLNALLRKLAGGKTGDCELITRLPNALCCRRSSHSHTRHWPTKVGLCRPVAMVQPGEKINAPQIERSRLLFACSHARQRASSAPRRAASAGGTLFVCVCWRSSKLPVCLMCNAGGQEKGGGEEE